MIEPEENLSRKVYGSISSIPIDMTKFSGTGLLVKRYDERIFRHSVVLACGVQQQVDLYLIVGIIMGRKYQGKAFIQLPKHVEDDLDQFNTLIGRLSSLLDGVANIKRLYEAINMTATYFPSVFATSSAKLFYPAICQMKTKHRTKLLKAFSPNDRNREFINVISGWYGLLLEHLLKMLQKGKHEEWAESVFKDYEYVKSLFVQPNRAPLNDTATECAVLLSQQLEKIVRKDSLRKIMNELQKNDLYSFIDSILLELVDHA